MQTPQLSIIVPIYNERDQLPFFLDTLALQQGLIFELIFCDGRSTDGTVEEICRLEKNYSFTISVLDCERGRSRQLNIGAETAHAETLLFLHVDSRFTDRNALLSGWNELREAQRLFKTDVAGHFALKFRRNGDSYPQLYYHLECKARLDREECTHGDQGFMVSQETFLKTGVFDDLFPLAEDTRFAERLRNYGRWILFSVEIETSARRFEVEGIKERQTFSSILMNCMAINWTDFFKEAANLYPTQDQAGLLQLAPYFRLIQSLLKKMTVLQRLNFWYATGRYVRSNAWQIPFYFDTRARYRAGLPSGGGSFRRMQFHDQWIESLLDHPPGNIVAGILTWLWYRITMSRQ